MKVIVQNTCNGCDYLSYRYCSPDSFDEECEYLCKKNYRTICYSEYGSCKIPDWCTREDVVEINLQKVDEE